MPTLPYHATTTITPLYNHITAPTPHYPRTTTPTITDHHHHTTIAPHNTTCTAPHPHKETSTPLSKHHTPAPQPHTTTTTPHRHRTPTLIPHTRPTYTAIPTHQLIIHTLTPNYGQYLTAIHTRITILPNPLSFLHREGYMSYVVSISGLNGDSTRSKPGRVNPNTYKCGPFRYIFEHSASFGKDKQKDNVTQSNIQSHCLQASHTPAACRVMIDRLQ